MTVINQNSISGITSITAASGSVQIFNSDGSTGSLTNLAGVNVVGVVTATSYVVSAGTTSAPSISPSGDSNTGIFFPSADTIAFGEGGSEVARFDSSGRLGIGTASPSAKLEVSGGDINISTNGQFLRGKDGAGDHKILLGYSAAQTVRLSEFCYLDVSNSRFGIGTTSPVSALNVSVADGGNVTISNTNDGHTGGLAFGDTSSNTSGRVSYDHFNNSMRFDTAGTERVRLDSSGRLLVGTSSAVGNARIQLQGNASDETALLDLRLANNNPNSGTTIGSVRFSDTNAANGQYATIACVADAGTGSADFPGRLVFSTTADGASSPTERMRITAGGIVRISNSGSYVYSASQTHEFNTDTYDVGLAAYNSNASFTNTVLQAVAARNTSNSTYNLFKCSRIGIADVFIVRDSGNALNTNNSYTGISDIKLKENIVDANSQWDDIKALRVRNYNFKEVQTHRQIGLIAQEVEPVCPGLVDEAVDRDAEGNDLGTTTKSVNYSVLYMKAVKALQEAMERIEALEAKVAALEAQ